MRLLCLHTVLLATELDESSLIAATTARQLGRAAGASVHVIHVRSSAEGERGASPVEALDATSKFLERADFASGDARIHVDTGDPAWCIRRHADRIDADVIVLGRHRSRDEAETARGLGGTALAVVTNSYAPCLVVPHPLRLPLRQVLVPVDLSDTSRGALRVALSWASALREGAGTPESGGTSLTALFVADSRSQIETASISRELGRELDDVRQNAGSWAGVELRDEIVAGRDVTTVILEKARERGSDLIVLGTRGLGLDEVGRLGSVAGRVAQAATVPILLVPPALWASISEKE